MPGPSDVAQVSCVVIMSAFMAFGVGLFALAILSPHGWGK